MEANSSNYILLYVGVKFGMDKNRGNGGSANGCAGGGSGSVIIGPLQFVTVTHVHGFHSFSHPAARQTHSMHDAERDIADPICWI